MHTVYLNNPLFHMIKSYGFDMIKQFLQKRLAQYQEILKKTKYIAGIKEMNENLNRIEVVAKENDDLEDNLRITNFISAKLNCPSERRRWQLEKDLLSGDKNCIQFLNDFFESEMARGAPPEPLLLLFCLESLTAPGYRAKTFDNFRKEFLMTYGMENVFLLRNLENAGMLRKNEKNRAYGGCLEQLKLIETNINLLNPDDTSYIFGGYCPISIRLIEKITSTGLSPFSQLLNLLPGPQLLPKDDDSLQGPEGALILLVFVGGVTLSEMAAIRFLNRRGGRPRIVVVTTGIVQGEDIVERLRGNGEMGRKENGNMNEV